MSRMTPVLLAAAVAGSTLRPPPPLTATQAMRTYEAMTGAQPVRSACKGAATDEIVVCGAASDRDRLPLRDDRDAQGDVAPHADEAATGSAALDAASRPSCARPGSCEPSRLLETVVKLVKAATGDPP